MKRTLVKHAIDKVNKEILVQGFVDSKRDHGSITFIDLRDYSGLIQIVGPGNNFSSLKPESIVAIVGKVVNRPEKLINPNLETGKIEIQAWQINVISPSLDMPIPISTDGYDIDESLRLKYRYLDLRRSRLNYNMRLQSQIKLFIRNYLNQQDFVEIDTPILTKTTPEGARDFLVPSRLQPGNFYALPQSPQQYKQLLMVAGFEKYFQFARCFRDEDPRSDRAYGEFTQLDLEISFVSQEDILRLIEEMFTKMVNKFFPHKQISTSPWPRIPHSVAVQKYNSDKPDLRSDKKNPDELAFAWIVDFPLFNKQSKEDFYHGLGKAKLAPSHHMFTAPHPDDVKLLETDPLNVRGLQHDLVLNGFEVGGGSIRIHQKDIQNKIFDLIGFTAIQKKQFRHMLTAFEFGVPPHGGIAPGIDRLIMALLGETSIREVIAFPTSSSGQTAVMDAPSKATADQLKELRLKTI